MGRHKAAIPRSRLELKLPIDIRAQLDLALVSDLEGRVPLGYYSEFIGARLREHFGWRTLDLAAYGYPAGYFVRGPKEMIETLRLSLEQRMMV